VNECGAVVYGRERAGSIGYAGRVVPTKSNQMSRLRFLKGVAGLVCIYVCMFERFL
jgi:hypothetical protein